MLKKGLLISFLAVTIVCGGCKFTSKRPNTPPTPVPQQLRMTTRITKRDVQTRMTRIEGNIKKDRWDKANKEVNRLGSDMLNYYPVSGKGRSLLKMGKFDGDYAKLKVSVKTRRKRDALGDLVKMRRNLQAIS
jgi:hypothetical protein